MNWTAEELRTLRYRMGWSQAEMARCLKLDLSAVISWEAGRSLPQDASRGQLSMIMNQAEANAEKVQRRPIAEVMMKTQGLSQIHDLDVMNNVVISVDKKTQA